MDVVGTTGEASRYTVSKRAPQRAFLGVAALVFVASAALTIFSRAIMPPMGEMTMPGGWTMSTWMRMPGETWPGAAASFVVMWDVMMVAMMLPSLVPMLLRYRRSVDTAGASRLGSLTMLAGAGYFAVWTMFGVAAHSLGLVLVAVEFRLPPLARAVPIAIGMIVLLAGLLQFTAWKAHHLACCRQSPRGDGFLAANAPTAWRYGLRLGLHCTCACVGLTLVLLVTGVMDLRAMALLTAAISFERLARDGERVARGIGTVIVSAGLLLMARAAGLG